jgi:two-component system, NarL family, nitrate/nitrite response regulator NarL
MNPIVDPSTPWKQYSVDQSFRDFGGTRVDADNSLKILIVDDQAIVRRAVRQLLESERSWSICGEAADGRDAISKIQSLSPDVVVMDLSMPVMGGLEATREIHQSCPRVQVLILTLYDLPNLLQTVQEAGAQGCVLKSNSFRDLVPAVASLSKKQPYFRA